MPGPRTVAVVTAISEELAPILDRLDSFSAERLRGRKVFRAKVQTAELVLAVTGDGAKNAARGVAELCEAFRPTSLVGLGVAGALTPSLSAGDLVAGACVRNGSGDAPSSDAVLLSLAAAAGARPATLLTVSAPVVSVTAKSRLASSLEGVEAAAVDMESAAWARAAAAAGVPFLVVRAISDLADEELPGYLLRCVGKDGGIRRSAVIRHALAHPSSVPALLRSRRRVAECGRRLAVFLLDALFFP
jgi:adenosylhomocysteine nucleosidase